MQPYAIWLMATLGRASRIVAFFVRQVGARIWRCESSIKEPRGQLRPLTPRKVGSMQEADAVYVLHCFQKKTQKTSGGDTEVARTRFKELTRQKR